jgi:hypothetical protein
MEPGGSTRAALGSFPERRPEPEGGTRIPGICGHFFVSGILLLCLGDLQLDSPGKFNVSYFAYGSALLNALVIAKVIFIGEYARLGKRHETKPLLLSATYKAFFLGY